MSDNAIFAICLSLLMVILFAAFYMIVQSVEQETAVKAGLVQKVEGGYIIWTKP